MSEPLPSALLDFIATHIDTLDQLEILLLLSGNPKREWTAAAVAAELRLNPEATAARLASLHARGFLAASETPERRYNYAPTDYALDRNVTALARAHAERRVAVITAIFSPENRGLRSFADAFKLKRRDE